MSQSLLDQLLDQKPVTPLSLQTELNQWALPPEEFEKLSREIEDLRLKIQTGHQCSPEEGRKIIAYFLARRAKNFQIVKPKEKKPKEGKPKVVRKKKEAVPSDINEALKLLGL
jgi:uncharacterized coiled-coil DUF342 family protein